MRPSRPARGRKKSAARCPWFLPWGPRRVPGRFRTPGMHSKKRRKRKTIWFSFCVEHRIKQQETCRGKDHAESCQKFQLYRGRALTAQYLGSSPYHADHCRKRNGQQKQGQHEFAIARANGHGGKK